MIDILEDMKKLAEYSVESLKGIDDEIGDYEDWKNIKSLARQAHCFADLCSNAISREINNIRDGLKG